MMRSLYSGISGLRNHQTRMDVIGNNIANVNTAGYKTSRVIFQDIFSQNVSGGMSNQGDIGGTNPMQIGLGIRLSTVDVIHTRSAFQRTDNPTDMMINGDGFFILMQVDPVTGEETFMYTRAGNFSIDDQGFLVNSQGMYVMGNTFDLVMGIVDEGQAAVPAVPGLPAVPAREAIAAGAYGPDAPAIATVPPNFFRPGDVIPAGLLGAGPPQVPAADQTVTRANMTSLNSLYVGRPFMAPWPAAPGIDPVTAVPRQDASPEIAFRAPVAGLVQGAARGLTPIQLTGWARDIPVWRDLTLGQQADLLAAAADPDNPALLDAFLAQFPEVEVSLPGFSVADNGDVEVIVANRKLVIGRVALAMFANPPGLEKAGNSLYRESASSGPVVMTEAFMDGSGKIDGGGLEMSNVDLANEFTDMIVTQRGFQANSRIITVSDTMLEELVNLKR